MHPIPHGGRLIAAERRYPDAPRPFIDLSTGINPNAYPFTPPGPAAWRRLPEPEQVAALEAAAARAYGAVDPAMVVAAPGTQALIQCIPRLFPQRRVAIADNTYAEHAAAWRAAGTAVVAASAPATVLCNPNNPDGVRHDPAGLARHRHDLLVVDEAFADFEAGVSLVPYLPVENTVILRSFGKAYGLAGLRLGFAITTPTMATRFRDDLGPWPISGPAIAIGTEALRDDAWRRDAAAAAQTSAARLDELLQGMGLRIVGGTRLFRLAEHRQAGAIALHLAKAGILVRCFDAAPSYLRFGIPATDGARDRLDDALKSYACAGHDASEGVV